MYAIAFDMRLVDLDAAHPLGKRAGYADIERVMRGAGFHRVQGSVFLSKDSDFSRVTRAMIELRELDWFCDSVRDIRAFRVEDWSDFTSIFRERRR